MFMKILITGASSGIGLAVAKRLQGNTMVLTSRNKNKLEDVGRQITGDVHTVAGDTSSSVDVERVFNVAIEKMGEVDVAFLNAGVGHFDNVENLTEEQFDAQFSTNVKGVFLWLKFLIPHMRKRGKGQIIVTSSNLGLETAARCSLYAGSKHAVQAMVSSVRKELRGSGVKLATVNPGSVDTPWFDGKDVDRDAMLNVEDVVDCVLLLINQGESSDIELIKVLPRGR